MKFVSSTFTNDTEIGTTFYGRYCNLIIWSKNYENILRFCALEILLFRIWSKNLKEKYLCKMFLPTLCIRTKV